MVGGFGHQSDRHHRWRLIHHASKRQRHHLRRFSQNQKPLAPLSTCLSWIRQASSPAARQIVPLFARRNGRIVGKNALKFPCQLGPVSNKLQNVSFNSKRERQKPAELTSSFLHYCDKKFKLTYMPSVRGPQKDKLASAQNPVISTTLRILESSWVKNPCTFLDLL